MATKLFLRNTQTNGIGATYFDMLKTAGSSTSTAVVNTTSGGTEIQWTQTAGGSVIQWISPPLAAGVTLTTSDISIWAIESAAQANAGGRYRVFKRTSGGTETELAGGPFNDGFEFDAATNTEMTWVGNFTDTAFSAGDRILLKLYITNVGTMGASRTCTVTYNGADAATGDSFLNINENLLFATSVVAAGTSFTFTGATTTSLERGYEVVPEAASFAFTGQAVTVRHGYPIVAAGGSFTFTGSAATLTHTAGSAEARIEVSWVELTLPIGFVANELIAGSGTFNFTGQATSFRWTHKIAAETGSFAFTGQPVSLEQGYEITPEAAAFAFTGQSVTLKHGYEIAPESAAFVFTGQTASLELGREIAPENGSFVFTGQAVTLTKLSAKTLNADSGAFTFTGQAASLERGYEIAPQNGAFVFTGGDIALTYEPAGEYIIGVQSGAFVFTGQAIELRSARRLTVGSAAFAFTGSTVTLRSNRRLSTDAGAFVFTGTAANLNYSGSQPSLIDTHDYLVRARRRARR
jgi:hypothetical protein